MAECRTCPTIGKVINSATIRGMIELTTLIFIVIFYSSRHKIIVNFIIRAIKLLSEIMIN